MTILSNTTGLSIGSHIKVRVECDSKVSDKCRNQYEMPHKDTVLFRANHSGKIICIHCSRASVGTKQAVVNPNCSFDESLLSTLDSEAKAYLLGWFASVGVIGDDGQSITIETNRTEEACIQQLRDIVCPEIPVIHKSSNDELLSVTFTSKQMTSDVCAHLQLKDVASKSSSMVLPQFSTKTVALAFVRGFFDGEGSLVQRESCSPIVSLSCKSSQMLKSMAELVDVPHTVGEDLSTMQWSGVNALDFLGKIYDGSKYHHQSKYNKYMDLCVWCPAANNNTLGVRDDPMFTVSRTSPDAVIPSKSRASDSGYDLTVIKTVRAFNSVTTLYDTCIKVRPPPGFYMDVVPRSSLSKSGYMLANSVGIIDRAYVGSIMIALTKVDPNAPDIQLPFCGFQMIPRPIIHFQVVEVTADMLEDTGRGAGGFGSTEERAKNNGVFTPPNATN
ncbi:dUTP diphosphatase [Heterostelium album PN500]|uniref:dUTP diphosphatase n=1 Tax=Heterostelium pallidum (strain ATCC 26659 / Pp 5 / PN500) TaxID=670386 RepID=D3BQ74_HETP5|nr:dUTP diphosphatase [Heterostelium album PN500]EFA76294.1 dUTP diphosphatase [Heterostelium album PN500]|eukprot:XP_020428426.1 dUTP diphosphatase [Heterostelium album PN500]